MANLLEKQDSTIILEDRVKKIYQMSRSRNKIKDPYFLHWFKIDKTDYFVKNEYLITSIINELIGELLVEKLTSLKSVELNVIQVMNKNILEECFQSYISEDGKIYNLISRDFKEKNKNYFSIKQLIPKVGNYKIGIEILEKYCIDKNNFIELKKDIFSLIVLHFFIGQWDDWDNLNQWDDNIIFEKLKKKKSPLLLSNTLDYAKSFNFDCIKLRMDHLRTYFGPLFFPSYQFSQILYEYPENIEVVKAFINLNVNDFFREFEKNGPIKFSKELFNSYVNFCEKKQHILSRCLR